MTTFAIKTVSAIVPHVKEYKIHSIISTFNDLREKMTADRTKNLVSGLSSEGVSSDEIDKIVDVLFNIDTLEAENDATLPEFVREWKKVYVIANGTKNAPYVQLWSSAGGWYTVQGVKKRKCDFIQMTEVLKRRIAAREMSEVLKP